MKNFILINLFILILSSISAAQTKKELCESSNVKASLIEFYSVSPFVEELERLRLGSLENPLTPSNQRIIKEHLEWAFIKYESEGRAYTRIVSIMSDLSGVNRRRIGSVIDKFINDFQQKKTEIDFLLRDEVVGDKIKIKESLVNEIKSELENIYLVQLQESLAAVGMTTENQVFFSDWIFKVAPERPDYVVTAGAETLREYVWWLQSDFGKFKTSGRFTGDVFWFQTNYSIDYPGLRIRLNHRKPSSPAQDANIELSFSPFKEDIQMRLCSFETKVETCEVMGIQKWCEN